MIASREPYTKAMSRWLNRSGHYLENAPPGAIFLMCARRPTPGLFGDVGGELVGMCLIGRPEAPGLPQDCSVGNVTRFVLVDGLEHGTASWLLVCAAIVAGMRRMDSLIAYHDRTRHTGCIYRKAGFVKDGKSQHVGVGWGNRPNRKSAELPNMPKQRWRLDLAPYRALALSADRPALPP